MIKKVKFLFVMFFILAGMSNIFAARLFYLSTDKTFSENDDKKVKVESENYVKNIKIRVYKIIDPVKFYYTQNNFHKPIINGRKLRYYTPKVVDGFSGYLRGQLRSWAREAIPSENRTDLITAYPDFAINEKENDLTLSKIVDSIKDPNLEKVKEFVYSIENGNQEWNYSYIDFNDLQRGTYLIEGVNDYNIAYTVLNISDFGFIVKKANDKLLVYTINNSTGEPAKDINLTIYDRFKKELKKVKTGNDGIANTNVNDNDIFIIGKSSGGSYSFYDPKYYSTNTRDTYVYIYTDRPVYKPNDTVNFKGVIRSYKDDNYSIKTENNIKIEILDSTNNVIESLESKSDVNGVFFAGFNLQAEPVTGRYVIVAEIAGKKFEGEFKVEYYKKPEFQVLVKPKKNIYTAGEKVNAAISAKYYFGDAVKEGNVSYSIYRTKFDGSEWEKTQVKSFYITEQEYKYSQMELLETKEVKLDKSGNIDISFTTKKDSEAYNYSIQATVYNDAGIPIGGNSTIKVVPASFRVGITAEKSVYLLGDKVNIGIITTDYSGNPVSRNINVRITTETSSGKEYIFFDKVVKTDSTGNTDINFKAEASGFVKVDVYGNDDSGNLAVNEKYFWIGDKNAAFNYQGGMIKMVLDKKSYQTGETAKLLLITPIADVNYLYTIEGDSIYESKVEKFTSNSAIIEIPVKSNYLPNVFVNVSYMFDNQLYENSIKLDIPPLEKFINIEITPERETFAPKSSGNVKVKVTDNNGKPVKNANLSIAVVDEAIYAISPEIAVDVYKYFYPFRRNNVSTFSSIGFRFYGYAMDVNSELSNRFYKNPTGLAAFKDEDMKERKEFKDTVLWLPALTTDENGEAAFTINFAANITKWRITAVGITPDTKVGKGLSSIITRLDFFSELNLPNYLNEKDEATLYTTTHNYTASKIEAALDFTSDTLKIEKNRQNIKIDQGKTLTTEWKVSPIKVSNANVSITSTSDQLKDKVTKNVQIIPHSILKTDFINSEINAKNDKINFTIGDNVKLENHEITLNLSSGYFSIVLDSIPYLINYPYGCVEQTTSSFLPDLVVINALKKLNIKQPEMEKKLPDIVSKALSKLSGYQNIDGSWGWWKDSETDIFMTSYVMYALTLSKNLGYPVTEDVFNKGLESLNKNIAKSKNDTEKLYALYVLSMNNKKIPSILQNFQKKYTNLNDYEMALLILTDFNYNYKDDGKKVSEELRKRAKKIDNERVCWGETKGTYWYNDSIETTAWAVRALAKVESEANIVSKIGNWLFNKSDIMISGIQYLISEKEGSNWKSTRDTAAVVYAITDVIGRYKFDENGKKYTVTLNGNKVGDIVFNKNNFWTELKLNSSTINKFSKQNNELKVAGLGKEELYLSFAHRYYTNETFIKESNSGVKVERNYYKLEQYNDPNDTIHYRIGQKTDSADKNENILVELKVSSDKKQNYIMVEDYFPAGCIPIKDFLLYNIDTVKDIKLPDFADFRDTKVIFFNARGGQSTFYYVMMPVFKGNYKVLPAQGSLMYFPDVRGNSNQNDFSIK
jgi:alpha-2-macroglobulin